MDTGTPPSRPAELWPWWGLCWAQGPLVKEGLSGCTSGSTAWRGWLLLGFALVREQSSGKVGGREPGARRGGWCAGLGPVRD